MAELRPQSRADRRHTSDPAPAIERRAPEVRDLEVRVEQKTKAVIVLRVANELVMPNHHLLDEVLGRLTPAEHGQKIELEMSHVPYADSEALGHLMSWARKFGQCGASLVLVNPTPYVTSILELLEVDRAVPIVRRHAFSAAEP